MTTARDSATPPAPTRGQRLVPLLLLVVVVLQWVQAGGIPRRGGSTLPALLFAALVGWLLLTLWARMRRALGRLQLPVLLGLGLALGGTDVWLVAQGRLAPLMLLPWVVLLGFLGWLTWLYRRAVAAAESAPPPSDPGSAT